MCVEQVSASIKRLKTADLIRHYVKGGLEGFVLHPEIVIVGEHQRARALWYIAGEQAFAKINATSITLAKKMIKSIMDEMQTLEFNNLYDYDEKLEKFAEKTRDECDDIYVKNEIDMCFNIDKYGEKSFAYREIYGF
jgi:hypothetical protein